MHTQRSRGVTKMMVTGNPLLGYTSPREGLGWRMRGTAYRGAPALAPPLREDRLLSSFWGSNPNPCQPALPFPGRPSLLLVINFPEALGGAPRGRVVARQPKMGGHQCLVGGLGLQGPPSRLRDPPQAACSAVLLLGLDD